MKQRHNHAYPRDILFSLGYTKMMIDTTNCGRDDVYYESYEDYSKLE